MLWGGVPMCFRRGEGAFPCALGRGAFPVLYGPGSDTSLDPEVVTLPGAESPSLPRTRTVRTVCLETR